MDHPRKPLLKATQKKEERANSIAKATQRIDEKTNSIVKTVKKNDSNMNSGLKNQRTIMDILLSSTQNSLINQVNQIIVNDTIAKNALNEIRKKEQIFFQQTQKIFEKFNDTFKNWDFAKRLSELQKIANREKDIALEVKAIFLELDFPPHDDLFSNEAQEIVELYHTSELSITKAYVEELFLEKFDKQALVTMKSKWHGFEWLNNRISILEQVIEGHLKGYYNLTVPTLLAQTEGIVAQGFKHVGKMNGSKLEGFLTDLLSDHSTYSFDVQIHTFYTSRILAGFEHGKEINSSLSRHAILHGGDSSYGTQVNSLKCILIFDYLLDRLNDRREIDN
ncbi:hypothetical protein [Bacillus hominis]